MAREMSAAARRQAVLMSMPKRMMSPLYRTLMYIEFRAGAPDPAREARLERMRQLTRRR